MFGTYSIIESNVTVDLKASADMGKGRDMSKRGNYSGSTIQVHVLQNGQNPPPPLLDFSSTYFNQNR